MRRLFSASLMIAIILALFSKCSNKEPVVAVINNNRVITLSELQMKFGKGSTQKSYKMPQVRKMLTTLDQMIEDELKIIEAKNRDYSKDSSIVAALSEDTRKYMLSELFKVEIEDPIVPEKDIREYYKRQNKVITLRKIVIMMSSNMPDSIRMAREAKAHEVIQLLKDGESFVQLVKDYSDDKSTAMNGGLQKASLWTQWDDPVMEAAYHLNEGEFSEVIETSNSLVIIQVEKKVDNKLKPYQAMHASLRSQLLSQRRRELRDYYDHYWEDLKTSTDLVFNDSLLQYMSERFFQHINRWHLFVEECKEYATKNEDHIAVSYKGNQLTMVALAEKMATADPRQMNAFKELEKLKEYATNQVLLDVLYQLAQDKNLEKSKNVKSKQEESLNKLLLNKMKQVEIDDKIIDDRDSLRAYYDKHVLDKYSRKERVKIQEIIIKDKDKADLVYKKAKSGMNFTRLVQNYSEKEASKKKNGFSGYFYKGTRGRLGDLAFKMKNNDIGGPVEMPTGEYIIFKRIDYKPLEKREFLKVYEDVKYDYSKEQRARLNSTLIRKLKDTYPVKLYKENMESIIDYD